MKKMLTAPRWQIAMLTLALIVWGQSAHCEPHLGTSPFVGVWCDFSFMEGRTRILSIKQSGMTLIANLEGHNYVLYPSREGYSGRSYANVADIQKNVTSGGRPISAAMAASASAQRAMWFDLNIKSRPGHNGVMDFIGVADTFNGRSYLHNGTRVNFLPLLIQVETTWERKPVLDANFKLDRYINIRSGSLDYVFKDLFQKELNNGGLYYSAFINGGRGHAYLCINLVAHRVHRKAAMEYLKSHLAKLFPFDVHGADGISSPDALKEGVEYCLAWDDINSANAHLMEKLIEEMAGVRSLTEAIEAIAGESLMDVLFTNKVRVTSVTDHSFTFYAIPHEHILRGTATHGLFEDMNGDLYMYQQGRGEADESFRSGPNVLTAGFLWKRFADRLKEGLSKSGVR